MSRGEVLRALTLPALVVLTNDGSNADWKGMLLSGGVSGIGGSGSAVAARELCTVFPSISRWGLGRVLGQLYESLPLPIGAAKLSYLLFCLPTAPVAAAMWLVAKVIGERYVLTMDAVERRRSIGGGLVARVPLADVAEVKSVRQPWEQMFRSGTVSLVDATGRELMSLGGVSDPESFAATIRDAVTARKMVAASVAHIAARRVER